MKKLLSAVLTVCIALSVLSPFVWASEIMLIEEPVTSSAPLTAKSNEPTTEELEKIIKIVKPKLDVPEECKGFDWNYNAPTYYSTSSWRLTWFNDEYSKEVTVSCDADGNILSYSFYEFDSKRTIALPEYSKAELEKTAFAFLHKLCPDASKSMVLEKSYASSLYSQNFIYQYVRYENGVIVPDNTASVSVNYITGTPVSLNCNFNYAVDFGDTKVIDAETAKKALEENQKMTLSYRLKNEYDENGKLTARKAYLVYTPDISYLSVDAVTGKVYTQRNTWTVASNRNEVGASGTLNGKFESAESDSAMGESEYQLSEEELAQLTILENLITRQQAIDKILKNEYLYINSKATAVEAQLVQKTNYLYGISDEEDKDLYMWNLYFSAPYEQGKNVYFNPYMNAVIDAQTGDIVSFSANVPGYGYYSGNNILEEIPENKFTKEQTEDIFTEFANTVVPQMVKNTRVSYVNDTVVINYTKEDADGNRNPLYRSAGVNLVRVNEGIDFTYNNISGEVDRVTGKVTRFSYTWYDDVVFESPKDAISAKDAYRVLLDSDGFGLNYEINSDYTYKQYLADSQNGYVDINELYDTKQYTRFVYSGYNYLSTVISALKGEMINYSGTPVVRETEANYTDIDGHWAEKDIRKLTDLGFRFEENLFKPDSEITPEEFLNLMNFFNKYSREYFAENTEESKTLTRTEAVKHIIDSAGYYKIAGMPDIFITDFADNSELLRQDVGFIAIARGMGLVQGSANSFRPYDNITRAEAVTLIFNFVKLPD